ncbi:flagellar hook-associated protein FlgL [Acetonema longum]|uniref:Flagellar hook-associated protein FlgL n=1 Tax=Acetonema longum DSM 6540 TaxID=1009370 RepID=F7NH06_9FIRM|nr:flagellar hook-associated protein FlgL [Acetonema longum]EGO64737.1 flagellar hook-associated protein FlgL [Acetonema longum DSM 6540]
MRITNNMMIADTVWNINKNAARLSKAQQQMSSQQKIQLPSDDPVVATRAIKYRNYVDTVAQYQKNVEDAASWQKVTESALNDLGDIITRARELTVEASSDVLTEEELQKIKAEVIQLQQEAVDVMNTSYAGRYVFAGFATDEAPFELVSTSAGDKVMFKGQYLSIGGPMADSLSDADITAFCTANASDIYQDSGDQAIQYNIGYGAQVAVNLEGQDVTGQETDSNLFDTFAKLLLALDGETSYKTAEVSGTPAAVTVTANNFEIDDLLTDWDEDHERVLTEQADLGARMNYVNMTKNRLSNDHETYTTLMSNNEDVDTAEASIALTTAEYVYEASLAVGAKTINKTLVDFLA